MCVCVCVCVLVCVCVCVCVCELIKYHRDNSTVEVIWNTAEE